MVTIESSADRRDGVTLVTATITDAAAPTRITVASRLDGPVWPPRRQGEPAAGWEIGGTGEGPVASYEGVVPADGRLAIGFASPAEPVDPPVEVTAVEPASEEPDDMATPAAVLRGLGDPSPPSLIAVEDAPSVPENGEASPVGSITSETTPIEDSSVDEPGSADDQFSVSNDDPQCEETLPPEPAAWLAAVERRIERAEALEATAAVGAATEALRECGGVEGARTLDARLATDAEHLRTLADRSKQLADRAESTTVATEDLERLS